MAVQIRRPWRVDELLRVDNLTGEIFTTESNAHEFVIYGVDKDGETIPITGTISGAFLRADGATVPINAGTLVDGEAHITLPSGCYAVQGRFVLSIYAVDNGATGCIYCGVGNVYQSQTDTIVDPGTIMPSISELIARIEAAVNSIPSDYSSLAAQVRTNATNINTVTEKADENAADIATLETQESVTAGKIGNMSNLITPTKTSLVEAINEAYLYDPTADYDESMSATSENAVQNKAITAALAQKMNKPVSGGTAGQCLMSDGAGSMVWGTPTEVSVVLGDLALKDRVEATYTPKGTVSAPTITVNQTKQNRYMAVSASGGGSVTPGTAAACNLPELTATLNGKNLILSWTPGSFTPNAPTEVTLPRFQQQTYVTDATATATAPTFTGTEETIEST